MLVRIQRKWTHSLLVWAQIGAATMETSVHVFKSLKLELAYDPDTWPMLSGLTILIQRCLHICIYCCCIHNIKEMESS